MAMILPECAPWTPQECAAMREHKAVLRLTPPPAYMYADVADVAVPREEQKQEERKPEAVAMVHAEVIDNRVSVWADVRDRASVDKEEGEEEEEEDDEEVSTTVVTAIHLPSMFQPHEGDGLFSERGSRLVQHPAFRRLGRGDILWALLATYADAHTRGGGPRGGEPAAGTSSTDSPAPISPCLRKWMECVLRSAHGLHPLLQQRAGPFTDPDLVSWFVQHVHVSFTAEDVLRVVRDKALSYPDAGSDDDAQDEAYDDEHSRDVENLSVRVPVFVCSLVAQ